MRDRELSTTTMGKGRVDVTPLGPFVPSFRSAVHSPSRSGKASGGGEGEVEGVTTSTWVSIVLVGESSGTRATPSI